MNRTKILLKNSLKISFLMAEREGFEPSIRFPVYTLSKRAPSTTRPPLLLILIVSCIIFVYVLDKNKINVY